MLSVVLSNSLRLTKMILKYQSEVKTRTNEDDMMKRAKGKNCEYSKSKPDSFLRAKSGHMMEQFWTDRLPADS